MGTMRSSRTRRPALQGNGVCEVGHRCRQGPRRLLPHPRLGHSAPGPTPTAHCWGVPPSPQGWQGEMQAARRHPKPTTPQLKLLIWLTQ